MDTQINIHANRTPILGCIADDVTGATDLAINLVQGGMRVIQLLGVPGEGLATETEGFDAIVVALKIRSIPKQEAVQQALDSVRALQGLGDLRFYFKYCSTFDSTEQGNIGPIAEAMMQHLGVEQTIFCPAFPRAGRTVYRGHLFVGDTLLNESGMENHPLNPMNDANLVRFLTKQTSRKVGLLGYESLVRQPTNYANEFNNLAEQGYSLLVTDACDDTHLESLAHAVAKMRLVTGGSGLARFLPAAYRSIDWLRSAPYVPSLPSVKGRSLIVAGSCSKATQAQVNWMKSRCQTWPIDVAAVMNDTDSAIEALRTWGEASEQTEPLLVFSTAAPEEVQRLQDQFGVQAVASKLERFLATITKMFVETLNVRRLVLAGGETSGAIVNELGIRSLSIGPEICAGVPWTESSIDGKVRLALALKSGNFGTEDFFQVALEMLP